MLSEYTWCVVLGGVFCFAMGFGIGANDVSNNFGTSVGSKSISLKNAIIIAAIFEFIGSVCLGAPVTDSLRKGVYHLEAFGKMPDIILMANMAALMSGTLWLLFASKFGLPVSTSHSLIGAMVGCGLAVDGFSAIEWHYMGFVLLSWLVSPIVSAAVGMAYFCAIRQWILKHPNAVPRGFKILWLLLYLITSIFCLFFTFSNPLVFNNVSCSMQEKDGSIVHTKPCFVSKWVSLHSGYAALSALGSALFLTLALGPFCYCRAIKAQRCSQFASSDVNADTTVASTFLPLQSPPIGSSGASSAIGKLCTITILDRSVKDTASSPQTSEANVEKAMKNTLSSGVITPHLGTEIVPSSNSSSHNPSGRRSSASTAPSDYGPTSIEELQSPQPAKSRVYRTWESMPWNKDLHADAFKEDSRAEVLDGLAERFDPKIETFFTTLQIISASVACLVHGSNDVSNAAAPYASVYSIYREGAFLSGVPVPIWILILGGCSISVGLTFLGHRVIKRVGIKLLYISPSRGFCIEMAMASVMITASYLGVPLSTTHVAVGAMIGVGLTDRHLDPHTGKERKEGKRLGLNLAAINWRVVRTICIAWAGTMIVCGLASAAIFGFAIYSPTVALTRYTPMIR